jgi:TP901 family phage tail tape measure protein
MELSALNIIAKVKADLSGIKPAVNDANAELSQIGKGSNVIAGLDSFVRVAQDSLKGLGGSIAGVGVSITSALAPVTALGTAAVAAASDINGAFREIRVGTGATGAALDGLKASFNTVFANVPASAKDAGLAIAELNQLTGATGATLEGLATQQLNLARITGSDLKPQIEATSHAFNNFGISAADQGSKLDYLFKVSQQTGIGVTQLAQQMASSGGIARAAGLDFDTTAALIGQLSKVGIDASGVMSGFGKALKSIAAKGGDADPAATLQALIEKIKSAGSEAKQNAAAVEVFGKSGITMAAAIREGRLNIDDLIKSLHNSHDSINKAADDTRTFGESMKLLQNRVEEALAPLGREMTGILKSLMPDIQAAIDIVRQLGDAFIKLPDSAKQAIAGFVLVGGAVGPLVISIGGLVALLGGPLTAALVAAGAIGAVMAADFIEGMQGSRASVGGFEDALLELAKILGTIMDVVGVLGHTLMITFDLTFGVIISAIRAVSFAIKGDWSTAMAALQEPSRQAAIDFNQAWDEVNGKWSTRLQNMVGQAYAASRDFGAAGRANAAAYQAGLSSVGLGLKDPFSSFKPQQQQKSFSDTVTAMGGSLTGAANTAGSNAGNAAAEKFLSSFGKKLKGGGGGAVGKAMLDTFNDGLAGLDAAIAKVSSNSDKLGSLFDPATKRLKAGGEELKSALKAVADAVNDFFNAAGIKGAKLTLEQLASGWEKLQTVIGKAEAFKALKEAINNLNVDRLAHGLAAVDDSLKINGKTIEISVGTLRQLATAHHDVIESAQKVGFTFKEVFPATETIVADFGNSGKEVAEQTAKAFDQMTDKLVKSFEQSAGAAPHWAGTIVDEAERVKKALAGDLPGAAGAAAAGLLQMRAALDIRSSIDSAISDIERYGQQLGYTGQALEDFVESKTRQELGKFTDINKSELDAAIEAHRKAAIQLPGIWEQVFGKVRSTVKGWAADIIGLINTIPGEAGKAAQGVLRTLETWGQWANQILAILHRLNNSIPSSPSAT